MERVIAVTVKLGVGHGNLLVGLAIPAAAGEVSVEHQAVPGGKAYGIVEARYRFGSPPLIVDTPAVFDSGDYLPPFLLDGLRQPGGVLLHPHRLRQVYRSAGASA
jgi:hypothetical protein